MRPFRWTLSIPSIMDLTTLQTQLETLTVGELRAEFIRVMGYRSNSRNRSFLIRKILWGRQAEAEGGLAPSTKAQALARADVRDVTTALPAAPAPTKTAPSRRTRHRLSPTQDARLPVPGSVLTRLYQGREIRVFVQKEGFEFEGRTYRSLSAIARHITGSSYNGFLFFKLT